VVEVGWYQDKKITEKKMSNESIFLEADNGGIAIYEGAGNRVDWARDVLALSTVIENWNLLDRDNVFFTSSMDFASENGFKRDQDARILFGEASTIVLRREEADEEERRIVNKAIIEGAI
tara:strand:- start:1164 stop:1523 length:360 start_codon:yes stop_codon:yes gene_type:complete